MSSPSSCGWSADGYGRDERLVSQIGTINGEQVLEAIQGQRPFHLVDIAGIEFEILEQDVEHFKGHGIVDFEPNHIGETALPDALFHRLQQIARLELLNFGLGVASHMKRMGLKNFHAWKQRLQIVNDELFEPDEILGLGRLRFCFGFLGRII